MSKETEILIDIKSKYSEELNKISNKLNQLESNRFYEKSGAKMDGNLNTNIQQLRELINDLLIKIQYGKDSTTDELSRIINKYEI